MKLSDYGSQIAVEKKYIQAATRSTSPDMEKKSSFKMLELPFSSQFWLGLFYCLYWSLVRSMKYLKVALHLYKSNIRPSIQLYIRPLAKKQI